MSKRNRVKEIVVRIPYAWGEDQAQRIEEEAQRHPPIPGVPVRVYWAATGDGPEVEVVFND
jgi:hypothetical protein